MKIRVILVDDHPVVRNGVKNFLSKANDIEVIAEARDGDEAIRLVNELNPNVLLLDMEMPGKNGVEVTEALKTAGSNVKVLAFSGHNDREYIRGVLNSGAAGYITKDEPNEHVIEAIRGVAYGQQGWLSRKVKAAVMDLYQYDDKAGKKVTPREAEVHDLVYQGKTNKKIAYDLQISEKTVEKYIYSLFQKYEVVSRVQLAVKKAREKNE
jgi:two-component system, NarL family, response regulator DegU